MAHPIYSQEDRDFILGSINAKVDLLLEYRNAQEARIAALEKQIWWGKGALAIALLAFASNYKELIFHLF